MKSTKENQCKDKNCPIHGELKTRGRTFTGTVVSAKAHKTIVVEWGRTRLIPKYERYEKRKTKVMAHKPECMNIKETDIVKIQECRPLSKAKKFVVIEKIIEKNKKITKEKESKKEIKVTKNKKNEKTSSTKKKSTKK